MAKGKSLKTLKVRVNKDGTLSKKSLAEIEGLWKESVGDKLIRKINAQQVSHALTFAGLTVGIRYGLVNPLANMLEILEWKPGKVVGGLMEDFGDGLRTAFGEKKTSERLGKLFELQTLIAFRDKVKGEAEREQLEKAIAATEKAIFDIPAKGSELENAAFDKWFANNRVAIEWLVSMGMAGLAIKLAEQHTVAEITELIPGQ